MGARWHTKLERRVGAEQENRVEPTHVDRGHTSTVVGTTGTQGPLTTPRGTETEPIDLRDQPATEGALRNEDGTYTQRSSAETQTFRS
jgi:hypothetical protein